MGDGTNPLDPTQTHKHALHLIDGDALQSAFDSATKAEHDRKQGDKAARDKSADFFTSSPRRAPPPVAPPTSDAQTPAPLPSTLSSDEAHALMAELNQKLALHGIRLPPAPTPPAPPAPLSSSQQLALRIEAEQQLQNGMRSGSWSSAERKAHEAQLAAMKREADETSSDPEVQKSARYEDLRSLGVTQVCRQTDTVDSLTAQRDAILGAHDAKERGDEEQRINMGLDGKTGTPEQLALYEAQQRYQTYPTTGTGVILVGIASARGASTEELRAAGARGDMVEGARRGRRAPRRERARASGARARLDGAAARGPFATRGQFAEVAGQRPNGDELALGVHVAPAFTCARGEVSSRRAVQGEWVSGLFTVCESDGDAAGANGEGPTSTDRARTQLSVSRRRRTVGRGTTSKTERPCNSFHVTSTGQSRTPVATQSSTRPPRKKIDDDLRSRARASKRRSPRSM